jgi:hypothetical protein
VCYIAEYTLSNLVIITGWNFFLKKWWVQWKLRQLQPQPQCADSAFVVSQEDEDREKLRTLVKEEEVQ